MNPITRFRSSLTYPIAATLVLVTVVPVAVVGLALASYNREQLTNREFQYLSRQAVSLAKEVSLFIDGHRTQLRSSALTLESGAAVDTAFSTLLQSMAQEKNRSFVYLQIIDDRGEGTFVRTPAFDSAAGAAIEALLRDAHAQAIEDAVAPFLLVALPPPHGSGVILTFPLRSPGGMVWGSLQGVLDLGTLAARLQDNSFAGLLINIVDRSGSVAVSSDQTLVGRSMAASPLVADFLAYPQRLTQTYLEPLAPELGQVLGSVAPVEATGKANWGVVVERASADAFAPVAVMQQRTMWITVAAALIALALGFVMSRRLIGPIQNLAGVSSEIAEGNLAVRATVAGHDEIAQLSTNFNHMAGNVEALVRRLRQALRQNQELFLETIRTLAAAIDAKDTYTRGHSERVSSYSMAIARHLGLDQDEVFRVRIAAILHDVGKLGIKDGILNKPGGLTDEEFAIMRRHPEIGAQIMAPIRMLKDIIPGIRNHHETWDGTGYPDRLKAKEIPRVARIIGVADTFDAMTTTRPYQKAMTLEYVINRMKQMSGSRFDPEVIDAFMAAVDAGDMTPPQQAPHPQQVQEVS